MKSLGSKAISNEFVISPHQIQYKVESHVAGKKDSYTKLFPNSNLNQAEIIAMKQEQIRLEEELMKKKQSEEVNRKLKDNIKNYKLNQKEKEIVLKQNEIDKKNKIEKAKDYNKQLREKAIKKSKPNIEEDNVDYETFSFNDGKKEVNTIRVIEREETEREPIPIEKETFSNNNLNTQYNHNNIINIREDIDRMIKEKIQQAVCDVNLANFSDNINFNISNININQDINEELNKNVESVKEFRKTGLFKVTRNLTETTTKKVEEQTEEREDQNKSKNELEKRRYSLILILGI
jgi:hypothetical protein